MDEFHKLIDVVSGTVEYGYRVILGAALVRSEVSDVLNGDEAREVGRDAAVWVYSHNDFPKDRLPFWERSSRAKKLGLRKAERESMRIYAAEMIPCENLERFAEGQRSLKSQLGQLVDRGKINSRQELVTMSRRLARETAKAIKDAN